jgi:hypothetical protein
MFQDAFSVFLVTYSLKSGNLKFFDEIYLNFEKLPDEIGNI